MCSLTHKNTGLANCRVCIKLKLFGNNLQSTASERYISCCADVHWVPSVLLSVSELEHWRGRSGTFHSELNSGLALYFAIKTIGFED